LVLAVQVLQVSILLVAITEVILYLVQSLLLAADMGHPQIRLPVFQVPAAMVGLVVVVLNEVAPQVVLRLRQDRAMLVANQPPRAAEMVAGAVGAQA